MRDLRLPVALVVLVWLTGCQSPSAPEPEFKMPRSIVDLSPTISSDLAVRMVGEKAVTMFGGPLSLPFETQVSEEPFYLAMSVYTIDSHAGPHYDPPNHVIKGGASVESAPLDKFLGKARVLDFRSKPTGEPLLKSDFDGVGIEPGEVVIAFVGYESPTDPDTLPSYTYLSGEAAEYLAEIPIKAFATDMPSLGSFEGYVALMEEGKTGSENIAPEHYAFLSRDVPAIEGLVNLERLVGEEEVVFVGFPLKFEDGDGGPMRAAALVY